MTRKELIESDEYITATTEMIMASKKPIKNKCQELNEFFINLRNELLEISESVNQAEEIKIPKNTPKVIYLQIGDEVMDDVDFNELCQEEISFTFDYKAFENDIKYVLAAPQQKL